MRITNRMINENAIQNMTGGLETINKLQDQVSTGKAYQNASENPVNSSLSLSLRSNLRTVASYVETTDSTNDWMSASDFALGQLTDLATRANSLILRGLNETFTGKERQTSMGAELQSILKQAVDIANTSHNGQYIFSGYKIDTKPYSVGNDPTVNTDPVTLATTNNTFTDYLGATVTHQVVTYAGDSNLIQRSLGPDQNVTLNIPGNPPITGFLQALIQATEAMNKDTTVTTDPYTPGPLQNALTALQSSMTSLDQYRTSNGARMRQVQSAADFLDQVKVEATSLLSKKEDANMAEAMVLLASQKTTYQAVLEVSQRAISTLSLFDYLQ